MISVCHFFSTFCQIYLSNILNTWFSNYFIFFVWSLSFVCKLENLSIYILALGITFTVAYEYFTIVLIIIIINKLYRSISNKISFCQNKNKIIRVEKNYYIHPKRCFFIGEQIILFFFFSLIIEAYWAILT